MSCFESLIVISLLKVLICFACSQLFETIAQNCLNIRSLVIDFLPEEYDEDDFDDIEVKDLGWITSFERLEKLTIKCNVSSRMSGSWHGVLKEKFSFVKKC